MNNNKTPTTTMTNPNKISISRKGFDSSNGKMPNPIMPDGTLLSMPIPDDEDEANTYGALTYEGKSYHDIISSLRPRTELKPDSHCHLDPDLRRDCRERPAGWRPAFGQRAAALGVLTNEQISVGDLFLFFGWFRQTEMIDGKLRFVKGAPDLHVVYGYLQIGEIIDSKENIPDWMKEHPHAAAGYWQSDNAIYVAADRLSFMPEMAGAGCLPFDRKRVLTKEGCSRRVWSLPECFREIPIRYNPNAWHGDEFVSACLGQEFVFSPDEQAMDWVKNIIR